MKNTLLLLIALLLISIGNQAQVFTELTSTTFVDMENSSCAWGDYDNDGDLDFVVRGSASPFQTYLYENTGNGNFDEFGLEYISNSGQGRIDFMDYDNDGYLDIISSGGSDYHSLWLAIFRNMGDRNFEYQFMLDLGSGSTQIDFADLDNDGDMDLINQGNLYVKQEGNSFLKIEDVGIEWASWGSLNLGDYNHDGLMDALVTGDNGWPGYAFSEVYQNAGNGNFVAQNDIQLKGVNMSDGKWGDYDGDGDLDIILSGYNDNPHSVLNLYRNNGNNDFEEINISDQRSCEIAWGDYNNDGRLDFAVSYSDLGTHIYKNIDGISFELQSNENMEGFERGDLKWGDYDNDGDLDLLITGNGFTKIYTNNTLQVNEAPQAPTQIDISIQSDSIVISWNRGTDDTTPQNSLSYGVSLIHGIDEQIISPEALENGYRTVSRFGGTYPDTFRIVKNLKPGQYHCRVQSIDNGFKGSPFSSETTFYIGEEVPIPAHTPKMPFIHRDSTSLAIFIKNIGKGNMEYEITQQGDWFELSPENGSDSTLISLSCAVNNGVFRNGKIILNFANPQMEPYQIEILQDGDGAFTQVFDTIFEGANYGSAAWGDYDNDLDLDLVISGAKSSNNFISKLYINNGQEGFVEDLNFDLPKVSKSLNSWCDYNHDGNLDLIISGDIDTYGTQRVTQIYKNSGSVTLVEDTSIHLPQVSWASASFADYNQDGQEDLALMGSKGGQGDETSIFIHTTDNNFTEDSLNTLSKEWGGSLDWVDINSDSKPDLLQAGMGSQNWGGYLYINNGDGTFDSTHLGSYRDASWGDFNKDGIIDICLSGQILLFDSTGAYKINTKASLPVIRTHDWGDYDNDGDLDIVAFLQNYQVSIFENLGDASFKQALHGSFEIYGRGDIQFVDYNQDGKLDIMATGLNKNGYSSSWLFENNYYLANQTPEPPTLLWDSTWSDKVFLSWNEGDDFESGTRGINYNGYLYKENGDTIWTSISDRNSGFLKTLNRGNAYRNTKWKIELDEPGDYYWSIQSIDQAKKGSMFASEKHFNISQFLAFDPSLRNTEFPILKNNSIIWEEAFLEFISLEYSLDDGLSWHQIQENVVADEETFEWFTPELQPGKCKLKISNSQFQLWDTVSVNILPFVQFTGPVSNTQIQINSPLKAHWNHKFCEFLKLEYTHISDSSYTLIQDSIPAETEFYSWIIPNLEPSTYILRISDLQYPQITDTLIFEALPYLKLLHPTENEELEQNTFYDIQWESSYLETIRIVCHEVEGPFYFPIAYTLPASQNLYTWQIPPYYTNHDDFQIIISDNQGRVADTSLVFSIVSALDEIPKKEVISVHPNPCADKFFIELKQTDEGLVAELSDLPGKHILTKTLDHRKSQSINISDLEDGMYMLTIKSNKLIVYQTKIVKYSGD